MGPVPLPYPAGMEICGARIALRPWRAGDEDALVRHADNHAVWRNMTDGFHHPYTRAAAEQWIAVANLGEKPTNFAIVYEGEPVGGVGCERLADLHRLTAEGGYWLGESVWGRGLATEAFGLLLDYAWSEFDFERIEASVLSWNPASRRVLEKCGFRLEALMRRNIVKDGEILDSWLYAQLRGEWRAR